MLTLACVGLPSLQKNIMVEPHSVQPTAHGNQRPIASMEKQSQDENGAFQVVTMQNPHSQNKKPVGKLEITTETVTENLKCTKQYASRHGM